MEYGWNVEDRLNIVEAQLSVPHGEFLNESEKYGVRLDNIMFLLNLCSPEDE